MSSKLRFGALGRSCAHICVDMQRLFAEPTEWSTPWLHRVLPQVEEIARRHASSTVFTRFVPPARGNEVAGAWRRYYRRWEMMTLDRLGAEAIDLVPSLAALVPPARIVDKRVYSPWSSTPLHPMLREAGKDTLVVSGGETDVCVLATVLGAVDIGYRVVIATDALCSSADETHDALMRLYESRFTEQIEACSAETILASWS